MRNTAPQDFAQAIAFDRAIRRHYTAFDGVPYLHPSGMPLEDVDLDAAQRGGIQLGLGLFDEEFEADGCGMLCAADAA